MDVNQALAERVAKLLAQIDFMGYRFFVKDSHVGVVLQAWYLEQDVYKGPDATPSPQNTRKWALSPEMTDSEIVQTAFKCCMTSMEHRTREHFKYRGQRIFSPHFNVEDLVWICRTKGDNAGARRPE